jgi:hypothetical protein
MSERYETCHVYIIAHMKGRVPCAPVKIGISASPERRVANLQTANPKPLVLLCTFATPVRDIAKVIESGFHEVMADKRLAGEWFDIPPMLAVELMCSNFRGALKYFLDGDEEAIDLAMEYSGLLHNEEKLAKWRAHASRHLNDNRGAH